MAELSTGSEQNTASVTTEEMSEVVSGPALFANKLFVTMNPYGVRLTFCESYSDHPVPKFRQAVYMEIHDFKSFLGVLHKVENTLKENLKTSDTAEESSDED